MSQLGSQTPPFAGHCARCGTPVFGQYVASPSGPIHPACAQRGMVQPAGSSQSSTRTIATLAIVGVALVIGGIAVLVPLFKRGAVLVEERERKRGAPDVGKAGAELDAPAERPGFLWCDKASTRCDPSTQTAIKVYAGISEFESRDGVPCQRGSRLCVDPSSPAFTTKPGTKIVKITDESTSSYSTIRITDGTHAGKVGVVESGHFHDQPPR